MRYTVIGHRGFIGSALVSQLSRSIPPHDLFLPERSQKLSVEGNLGVVIYCAGLTADYVQRPFDTMEAHAAYLSHLVCQCEWTEFIYLSSTRLYDWTSLATVDETTPIVVQPWQPRALFDASKLLGEAVVLNAHPQKRGKVVRLSTVVNGSDADTTFWSQFLKTHVLRGSKPPSKATISVASTAEAARDYLFLDDAVGGILSLVDHGAPGVYNLASGHNLENIKVAQQIEAAFGVKLSFSGSSQVVAPPVVSIAKAVEVFGFAPRGLPQVIRLLRDRHE
jgi:nucleoside-diphosphate-sugar epimerase